MRRKEKEITDDEVINEIIASAKVCRLGLSDGGVPYVVPLCFGFKDKTLYFHSAAEGKKIEIIKGNPNICFEFDRNIDVVQSDKPCNWGMKYQSIVGNGKAIFIESLDEKRNALQIIIAQYTNVNYPLQDSAISSTTVFKVIIEQMTGKQSGI